MSVAVILSGTFAVTAYAAPTPPGLDLIIQKVVAKFKLDIANINERLQAQVIHVTVHSQDCLTSRTSDVEVGWCPDGIRETFSIYDKNYKVGDSIITAQATSPVDTGVVKITNCIYRAATGVTTAAPLIRFLCEVAPSNGATLNYVIVNH